MKFNFDKDKLFFTADPHYFHHNIIKFCNRPFKNVEEMNSTLIKNWNSVVPKDGVTFLLGDVGFGSASDLRKIIDQLNGKIFLINGNHDNPAKNDLCIKRFEQFNVANDERWKDYFELKVEDKDAPRGVQTIVLFHYPILEWNGKFHGYWHTHGHSHNNIHKSNFGEDYYRNKVIDVGVDGNNYAPLSYQNMKDIMDSKGIIK
jgi:calcineurin-like phosphoesterase family protein